MSDDTKVVVTRTINAPAAEIFDVLTTPHRHVELDGSGFVRSLVHGDRLKAVGDVFTMNMEGEHMGGEYQTDNHVVGYDENRLIAWKTAPAGTEAHGWQWVYELEPNGSDSTDVTLTYDWSQVTDKDLLKKVKFPLVPESDLEASLVKLSDAVSGS